MSTARTGGSGEGAWAERFVLLYESPPGSRERVPEFFAAHSAWGRRFHERGVMLTIGPFPDAEEGQPGAMGIFKTREAAEEFAGGDPFVVNGVVTSWRVRRWLDSYGT